MNVRGSIDPERIGQKREKRRHHALTHFSSGDSNGRRRRVRPLDRASGSLRSRARGGEGASRACASERRDPRGAPWRSWRRSGASACPRSRRTGRRARAARRSRSSRASRQVDARFERSVRGVRGRRGARAGSREGDCGVNAARARRRCVHVPRVVTGERATRAEASIFLSSSSSSWLRTSSFFRRAAAHIRHAKGNVSEVVFVAKRETRTKTGSSRRYKLTRGDF